MAARNLRPAPVTIEEFERRLRSRLKPGPQVDKLVALTVGDCREAAAHLVEEFAHPPSKHFGPGGGWTA
jgi:hypothetical protein